MAKRRLFDEMAAAVEDMRAHREGRVTLKHYRVEKRPVPEVDGAYILATRERLNLSRAVFARRLCVNERTLERWEQGRGTPNPYAAVLLQLVHEFPDTLQRLEKIQAKAG